MNKEVLADLIRAAKMLISATCLNYVTDNELEAQKTAAQALKNLETVLNNLDKIGGVVHVVQDDLSGVILGVWRDQVKAEKFAASCESATLLESIYLN
jgi:hypothetical protein